MDLVNFLPIPSIALVLYCIAEVLKVAVFKTDSQRALIPVTCALLGAVICGILFGVMPGVIPGDNVLTAIAEGIVSGLAATGANQVYRQLKNNINTINTDENNTPSE